MNKKLSNVEQFELTKDDYSEETKFTYTDAELLALAIEFAVVNHSREVGINGEPRILHILRVMSKQKTYDEMIVGVLHEMLQYTCAQADDLREAGINKYIVKAVIDITRRIRDDKNENDSYEIITEHVKNMDLDYFESDDVYYNRIKKNPLALSVKIADLEDNMDLNRIVGTPTEKDLERTAYYKKQWEMLTSEK